MMGKGTGLLSFTHVSGPTTGQTLETQYPKQSAGPHEVRQRDSKQVSNYIHGRWHKSCGNKARRAEREQKQLPFKVGIAGEGLSDGQTQMQV